MQEESGRKTSGQDDEDRRADAGWLDVAYKAGESSQAFKVQQVQQQTGRVWEGERCRRLTR